MRLATEILAIPLILAILLFLWSPSTALAVVFLMVLWAAWRRRPRGGARR
ncbi:hypothetical protein KO481_33535 [Nocardia sp. NEAU-G5]|uniref:Uncharacterized protein n=1 Tax=Nocardia albiluteola TaxID=2842303 RepID=A0ABS6B7Z6_9NOCA|nr:hypothetical protein [Nocardia albiluteola]MBU3066432.1 hypothetical protein [Nocardia albiluteola]